MAVYHVKTTGSDSTGDGSLAKPWRTISFARTQTVSGGGGYGSSPDTIVAHHDPALPFVESVPSVGNKGVDIVAADAAGIRADAPGWNRAERTIIQPAAGVAVVPDDYDHWRGFHFDGQHAGSNNGFVPPSARAFWPSDCCLTDWQKLGATNVGAEARFIRCLFADIGDRPFWAFNYDNVQAVACLFLRCAGGAYAIGSSGVLFDHCTAIDGGPGAAGEGAINVNLTSGATVRNCLVVDNLTDYGIRAPGDSLERNNVWSSALATYHALGNYSCDPDQSAGYNTELDPLLDGDLRPTLGSPCRASGTSPSTIATDVTGEPFGDPPDRGAYAFLGAPAQLLEPVAISFSADSGGAPVSADGAAEPMALGRDTLRAALLASIFSDRRAEPDDRLPGGDDRRGWWADALTGDAFGSRLWLLDRRELTDETAALAQTYLLEALQWMLDDGVASRVEVTTQRLDGRISGSILVTRDEGDPLELRFADLWEDLINA